MSERKIQYMLDEIREVASRHSGENAHVAILKRNDANYIQITISNRTFLDIEFHRTALPDAKSID